MTGHVAFVLLLAACSSESSPDAAKCGVTDDQLREAVDQVAQQKHYSARRLGNCDLLNDDTGSVSVITPAIKREVEKMIAREKAEATN